MRFDDQNDMTWSSFYGSDVSDHGVDIAYNPTISGRIAIVGWLNGSPSLQDIPIINPGPPAEMFSSPLGGTDAFIGRFDLQHLHTGKEKELTPSTFQLYPNPATGRLWIEQRLGPARYALYDATGRHILQGRSIPGRTAVDIADLATGLYFLRLEQGGQGYTRKFLVR